MKILLKTVIRLLTSTTIIFAQVPLKQANFNKLSPLLQPLANSSLRTIAKQTKKEDSMMTVILRTNDLSSLNGLKVRSIVGDVATAEVTSQQIASLINRQIEYIQEDKVERAHSYSNAQLMNVEEVHSGIVNSLPLKGNNVIIAIYDSGIDWKHPDFRQRGDTTKSRILFIWDQTVKADNIRRSPSGFNYGVEYKQEELNSELTGVIKGVVNTNDRTGHGTGVAGVAASNGQSSEFGFTGIAPEADLIVIKGGDNTFSEARIIDALSYVSEKAKELNKPVVFNLSLGSQHGAHNGSRLYERAIDSFCSQPGHAVVVAAGNDGDLPIHAEFQQVTTSDSTIINFTIPPYTPQSGEMNDIVNVEFWYNKADSILVKLISPNGTSITATTRQAPQFLDTDEGTIFLTNVSYGTCPLNDMNAGNIRIFDYNGHTPIAGEWKIVVKNLRSSLNQKVHFWLTEGRMGTNNIYFDRTSAAVTYTHIVTSPGNSSQAITVGSFNTVNSWININGTAFTLGESNGNVSSFSSAGPRIDGVTKPEILAPGTGLATSLSRDGLSSALSHKDGHHIAVLGTSFSAPQISGLVALMLQVNPALTSTEIKKILSNSATLEQTFESTVASKYGFGKINGIKAIMLLAGIEFLPPEIINTNVSTNKSGTTNIQWTRNNNDNIKGFEILRKRNSDNYFEVIASYKDNKIITERDTLFHFEDTESANAMYVIRELDTYNREKEYGIINVSTNLEIRQQSEILTQFATRIQNYPNPFNPTTVVNYQLSAISNVSLKVYDMLGREIVELANGLKNPGTYRAEFNATNLSSGVYYAVLQTNTQKVITKMLLTR